MPDTAFARLPGIRLANLSACLLPWES